MATPKIYTRLLIYVCIHVYMFVLIFMLPPTCTYVQPLPRNEYCFCPSLRPPPARLPVGLSVCLSVRLSMYMDNMICMFILYMHMHMRMHMHVLIIYDVCMYIYIYIYICIYVYVLCSILCIAEARANILCFGPGSKCRVAASQSVLRLTASHSQFFIFFLPSL